MQRNKPILVIGATGKTGRRVVELLNSAAHDVRAGSRNSRTPFDWQDCTTWRPALEQAGAVYITYYPDLAVPGAPEAISELVDMAGQARVERLVLLSGRGEANAETCERIVADSGIPYTLIRASWFMQNFSEGHLLAPVLEGAIALPAGAIREPFVDVDDIAEVAVAALTEDGHAGRLYETTGPRLLDFGEVAEEISAASSRPVTYAPVTLSDFHAGLAETGEADLADLLTELCREVLDGRNAYIGDGVQQALDRPPRDFTPFCAAAAAAGVWAAGDGEAR